MKNSLRLAVSAFLMLAFFSNILPCGPGFVTPIFDYKHAPENPYQNFAAGKLGILKPTYRRVVLLAAYRYLNNGSFTADEQQALVDVWNAEFNNRDFQGNDVQEALISWLEKRKDVIGKEEKIPEIYAERAYGGYDFFPNCTKNAFETATQTLSDRITSYGSEDKDVKAWLAAQDEVFANCASGKQTPEAPTEAMPEWLQKDRAYQIAAAEFYSLDYEKAGRDFAAIAQDTSSPWQETADYLVGRTLIRQASLTKDEAKINQFYAQAEQHLQMTLTKGGKFQDSTEKLLNLIKYRLHPKERVGELARNFAYSGSQNFRQDLIDYNWLLDKFEKETLDAEEKRKEELKPKDTNTSVSNTISNENCPNTADCTNSANTSQQNEGDLQIYLYTDDYQQNWTIYLKPDATDAEATAEAERVMGRPLTDKMKERLLESKKIAYTTRYSQNYQSGYQGGYYGSEKTALSILPQFLRQDELTEWLFTYQIQNTEAYLYSLNKFKQNGSDLWLLTALSKADKTSSELNRLLEASEKVSFSSPAYPTVAYHTARILIEQNKSAEAKKLLDEILASSVDLPVSSRNLFLELRLKLSDTLDDFLKFAQRKPFAFDFDGFSGSIEEFIAMQKSYYNAEFDKSKDEYEREVEEGFKEEKLWQERVMFDDKTIEIINEHFPLTILLEAEKSPALPDYLRQRFALAIWTRAALLEDFATASKIAPEVVKFEPEMEDLMNKFLAAKTIQAKKHAALYLILKTDKLTPYIASGMGTPQENFRMYATVWWCEPYDAYYDEETGEEAPRKLSPRPIFLTEAQSDAAQKELKKLKTIGDAPKFMGAKVLEWARLAPLDKRVPESLYIMYEANGWDKYGCGNNEELREEIGNFLKKRYPQNEWTQQMIAEESQNN
ncbi:MAG: hypothetical protein WA584_03600 [Pyrinomonadaceae bacterium]